MQLPRGVSQEEVDSAVAALSTMRLAARAYGDVIDVPESETGNFFTEGGIPTALTRLLERILPRKDDAPRREYGNGKMSIASWGGLEGFHALRSLADLGVQFQGSEGYRSDRPDKIEPGEFKEKVIDVLAAAGIKRKAPDKYRLVFPYDMDGELVGDLIKRKATPSAIRVALNEHGIHVGSNAARPEISGPDALRALAQAGLEFAGSEELKAAANTAQQDTGRVGRSR